MTKMMVKYSNTENVSFCLFKLVLSVPSRHAFPPLGKISRNFQEADIHPCIVAGYIYSALFRIERLGTPGGSSNLPHLVPNWRCVFVTLEF